VCVCLLYCVSYNEEFYFPTRVVVCVLLLFPLHFVSLKVLRFHLFFSHHLTTLPDYVCSRVFSLSSCLSLRTLLLCRDRTLRPSLDEIASELEMDSLPLSPFSRGFTSNNASPPRTSSRRVSLLSSRFNSKDLLVGIEHPCAR